MLPANALPASLACRPRPSSPGSHGPCALDFERASARGWARDAAARHGAAGGLLLLGRPELHLPGVLPALLRLQPCPARALHGRDLSPAAGAALLRGPLLPVAGWSLLALPRDGLLPASVFPFPCLPSQTQNVKGTG